MCYYRTDDGMCKKHSDDVFKSYCVDGPCPDDTPTNADRIRSMSDEELAKTLADDAVFYEEICGSDERTRVCDNDCVACALEWLKQPAKEEHHEV